MWFAFGLITLVASFTFSLIARSRANWKGTSRGSGDVPRHEYQEVFQKKKLTTVRIGMPAPTGLQFRVRKERWHDGLFKSLGISMEMQVEDPQFDDKVYLESDVVALGHLLITNHEMRAAIIDIFALAEDARCKKTILRCSHGRIWIELTPRDTGIQARADMLAQRLHVLAKALTAHRAMLEQQKDPFVWRAIIVLSVSTAAAALGILGVIRGTAGRTDILDSWGLLAACVVPGLLALAVFIALIVIFLGRSSRTHLVLIEVIFVGGLGFVLGLFALARELNVEFDNSPPQSIELQGVRAEHTTSRGRRGRRNDHFYLHVTDWRESQRGRRLRLEISSNEYRQFAHVKAVTLQVKPGLLGFEWIELIRAQEIEPSQPRSW
jgi:hypothetical protein